MMLKNILIEMVLISSIRTVVDSDVYGNCNECSDCWWLGSNSAWWYNDDNTGVEKDNEDIAWNPVLIMLWWLINGMIRDNVPGNDKMDEIAIKGGKNKQKWYFE